MAKPAPSSSTKPGKPKSRDDTELESVPAEEPICTSNNATLPNAENETSEEQEPEVEAEVLSHAAQRKAKKRKLKEAQGVDHSEDVAPKRLTKTQSKNDQPEPSVRQNSVWVGNLSFKTTEAQLKTFFSDAGEVSRIHMPKKLEVGQGRGMRGENRGFAYVDFTTPEGQTIAVTLSEKNLDGRRLLIKKGDDFTGRPNAPKPVAGSGEEGEAEAPGAQPALNTHSKTAQKILAAQKQPAAQTLFMGNLPFETKEEDIRQMIEGHGLPSDLENQAKKDGAAKNPGGKPQRWLKKIRMGTFEDSGLCKGWAFLDFLNTTYATAVLVNPRNHHLNGRKLVLEYGSPDAVRRGGGGPRPNKQQMEKEQPNETARAAKKRKFAEANAEDNGAEKVAGSPKKPKPKGDDQYVRAKDGRLRPKPGAALAMAKKEVVAIVPSTGKRTVF
ncbi:unnamed protein product [Rhizoctonia solani]|uniref:RRM domain-containing protein n=1 Tax=Rhizoctonia solani TaxID=456999 RepID=A0A8H3BGL7_9AGAM|nr:unnamed protein product [Rhizoctonia solani]